MKKNILALTFTAVLTVVLAALFSGCSGEKGVASSENIQICDAHGFRADDCYQCHPELLGKYKSTHDWCVEHNLPESQCIICDPFAKYKAKGDWCKGHSVPESQCVKCNPSLTTNQKRFIDWCEEHGVPESQCTICQPNLRFSLKSDWCQEHNVRDSECTLCHPELQIRQQNRTDGNSSEGDWCEHGFEKGDCFSCDPSLEGKFKKTGDWCGGHSVPESQCFKCQHGLQETVNERLKVSTVRKDLLQQKRAIQVEQEEALPAGAFCGTHLLRIKLSSKEMASTIGLRYDLARKRPLTESIKCNAEALYNKDTLAKISSRFNGTIKEVKVKLGQTVKKDDVLFVIDSPELGELRSNLETEKGLLELSESLYSNTQSLIAILKQKDLSASEVAGKVEQLEVGEAKTELLTLINEIESAKKSFDIQKQLKLEQLGTKTKFLDAQNKYDSAFASLGGQIEKINLDVKKSLLVQKGKVEKLSRKIGSVNSVGKVEGSIYLIKATHDGTVIRKPAAPGDVIEVAQELAAISDLSKMWIKIDLRLDEASNVKIGQHIEFAPRGHAAQRFFGTVNWLGSEIDDNTRMVTALAEVDSSNELLRKNTYGKVRIHIHRKEQAIVIPKSALQWEGCCHVVFVKMADDLFAPRKVKLGYEGKDFYAVEAGLLEGEQIVTQGSFLLKTEVLKSSIGAGCTD